MKYINIILLITLIASCNSSNTNSRIYPEGIFNKSEVQEISLMLKEFKKATCAFSQENSTECIKAYFENYWSNFKKGSINTQIDSNSLAKIIEPLSDNLRSKLFSENTSRFNNRIPNTTPSLTIPDTIKFLSINTQDSFMPLLSYLSGKYSNLDDVHKSFHELQFLIPSNISTIYSNWNNYDYSENTELLFLSLMIISQSDESIKREASYSKAISPIERELKNRLKNKN